MLIFDKTLHWIEAAEEDVADLFRSTSAATVTPPGLSPLAAEAFVCGVRKENVFSVYGALLLAKTQKVLVYVPDADSRQNTSYADSLKNARSFMEGMGFSLEAVNLNYSSALRQVIIRDIHVLRSPFEAKKIAQKKAAAQKAEIARASGQKALEKVAPGGGPGERPLVKPDHTSVKSKEEGLHKGAEQKAAEKEAARKLTESKAAAARLAAEKAAAEKEAAERLAAVQAETTRLAAEKAAAEAKKSPK